MSGRSLTVNARFNGRYWAYNPYLGVEASGESISESRINFEAKLSKKYLEVQKLFPLQRTPLQEHFSRSINGLLDIEGMELERKIDSETLAEVKGIENGHLVLVLYGIGEEEEEREKYRIPVKLIEMGKDPEVGDYLFVRFTQNGLNARPEITGGTLYKTPQKKEKAE